MTLVEKLIHDAEFFCEREGISLSRLATIVVNRGSFFKTLKNGGDCNTATYEKFREVFDDPQEFKRLKEMRSTKTS